MCYKREISPVVYVQNLIINPVINDQQSVSCFAALVFQRFIRTRSKNKDLTTKCRKIYDNLNVGFICILYTKVRVCFKASSLVDSKVHWFDCSLAACCLLFKGACQQSDWDVTYTSSCATVRH